MTGSPRAGLGALVVAVALLAGGCGGDDAKPLVTFPPVSFGTGTTSVAASETLRLLEVALRAEGFALVRTETAHRTAETATLTAAPRLVAQVALPDEPDGGYVTIYELRDALSADAAAREQAAYVGGSIGRVQFPPGTTFIVRAVGPTVVFFAWNAGEPAGGPGARIAAALETVGSGIDIPR